MVAGQYAGALSLVSPKMLTDLCIRHFVRKQHHIIIVTALGIAAGAALLPLPLSASMVRRIMTLTDATNRLASGHYDIQVAAASSLPTMAWPSALPGRSTPCRSWAIRSGYASCSPICCTTACTTPMMGGGLSSTCIPAPTL